MDAIRRLDHPPVAPLADPVSPDTPRAGAPSPRPSPPHPSPTSAPPSPAAAAPTPRPPLSDAEEVTEFVARLEEALVRATPEPRQVRIRQLEQVSEFVVEVLNRETGELITQFPPEKVLNLRERLDDLVGMVIDRTI
ncbi:MAG: flagellar protein FlaG [Candidatus Krumholzibacteriia bacterium]